jgi:hypothetical protein
MTEGTFEKVGHSDKRFYGPRKLLLCGFSPAAQPKFKTLLAMLAIDDLPLVWGNVDTRTETLGKLLQHADGYGEGVDSLLPRAIIAAGINEIELHRLMSGCKQAGMQQALWAVLTPFSEAWPLHRLLDELAAERKALSEQKPTPVSPVC